MSYQKATQITSWSFSRYSVYRGCPAKAKYKFIDKLPEPSNAAMERGNVIHKLAENYTKGALTTMPPELKLFKAEFIELKKSKPIVEETWAFTKHWLKTTWNDWANCALRIKTDAYCLEDDALHIIDHKTGKKRDGYGEQLDLYAVGGGLKFPNIKRIFTHLWYLDSGEQVTQEYDAKGTPKLQKEWEKKVEPMLNDTRFSPNPGNECRWCPYSKSKGGPCKF